MTITAPAHDERAGFIFSGSIDPIRTLLELTWWWASVELALEIVASVRARFILSPIAPRPCKSPCAGARTVRSLQRDFTL